MNRRSEADALPEEPEAAAPGPELFKNVVVVLNPPEKLPREVQVHLTLSDGTKLVTGPASRSWVDALKRNPGPASLRLLKGPVRIEQFFAYQDFAELDAEMRTLGRPMLVMSK